MMQPTIGRIVIFKFGEYNSHPAIITKVGDDDKVSLTVFGFQDHHAAIHVVDVPQTAGKPGDQAQSWHWPVMAPVKQDPTPKEIENSKEQ